MERQSGVPALLRYIWTHGRNTTAARLGVAPQYLSQIAHGWRRASPALARVIEDGTGGEVTRTQLRPDIWPGLRAASTDGASDE